MLLAACASGHARGDEAQAAPLTGTRLEHPRQECRDAHLPRRLPAGAEVADTAALLKTLSADANWRSPGTFAVVSLTFDGGQPLYPVMVQGNLPPVGKQAPGKALEQLVQQHVLTQAPSDSMWGVRFRLEGGPAPTLRVARQEFCLPRATGPANGYIPSGQAAIPIVVSDRPMNFSVQDQSITRAFPLRVLVDADGSVLAVDVAPMPELRAEQLRRVIEQTAPGVRFYPALRDGVPERAWADLYASIGLSR